MTNVDKFCELHPQRSVELFRIGSNWFTPFPELVTYKGVNYGTAFYTPLVREILGGKLKELWETEKQL